MWNNLPRDVLDNDPTTFLDIILKYLLLKKQKNNDTMGFLEVFDEPGIPWIHLMGGACHVDVMFGILGPTVKQN